jgi:hypothetical protein
MADGVQDEPTERRDAVAGEPAIAVLRGSQSQLLGAVSLVAEGGAAIALSRGGAPKRYAHTDPNEDASAFALGERGILLAVADGHNGCAAAEAAIDELMRRAAAFLSQRRAGADAWWRQSVCEAFGAIQLALSARVEQGVRGHCRSTLALALLLPDDDLLGYASLGDSHVFRLGASESVDIGAHPDALCGFIGNPADDLDSLAANSAIGIETLGDTRAVVLATDGISTPGIGVDIPEYAVFECAAHVERFAPELRALELARTIADAALAAHRRHRAGDNFAAAVGYVERHAR